MYSKEKKIQTNPELLWALCEKLFYLGGIASTIVSS